MGPFHFKIQQKAGWDLSMHKWYERGSHLLSCYRGCSWHHYHRVQSTHQGKIPKTSFLWLTTPFTLTKITADLWSAAEDSQTKTLLHKAWEPWKLKPRYGLTSAFKTIKSIANNYHTLKSQIKYFVELKYIHISGMKHFSMLAKFPCNSWPQNTLILEVGSRAKIVLFIKNCVWSYLLAEAGELTR